MEDVGYEDEAIGVIGWGHVGFCGCLVDDGVGGAHFEGSGGECIANEIGSFEGEEEVILPQFAGIGLNGGMLQINFVESIDHHGLKIKKTPERSGVF